MKIERLYTAAGSYRPQDLAPKQETHSHQYHANGVRVRVETVKGEILAVHMTAPELREMLKRLEDTELYDNFEPAQSY